MNKIIKYYEKNKIILISILLFIFLIIVAIPTFCQLLMTKDEAINYWDGTTYESYQTGTGLIDDPYIIANANQFAYFKQEINSGNTYENKYFKLTNDIYLNSGVIQYKNKEIQYINNSIKYYIKPYTNEYYQDSDFQKLSGNINIFETIDNFHGNFDGQNNTIYGLYISSNEESEVSLFKNLEGTINNLTFSNTIIQGTHYSSLITNATNSTIKNLIFNGSIINNSKVKVYETNLDDFENDEITSTITVDNPELSSVANIEKVILKGTFSGESIYINNTLVNTSTFEITSNIPYESLTITSTGTEYSLTNLVYQVFYTDDITSLITKSSNTTIDSVITLGNIEGNNLTSGIIGHVENNTEITNCYNSATVTGKYISAGLIAYVTANELNINNTYNSNTITATHYSSALLGKISNSSEVSINNSFNIGSLIADKVGAIIAKNTSDNITANNNYYIENTQTSIAESELIIAEYKDITQLLTEPFLIDTLNYNSTIWNISTGNLPTLLIHDITGPNITIKSINNTWNHYHTPKKININEVDTITVEYEDISSDILTVEYLIDSKLSSSINLNNAKFNIYQTPINISKSGYYTIYFKITDSFGNTTYANTDTLILDAYSIEITDEDNHSLSEYNNQITDSSSIKYHFKRNITFSEYPYTIANYYLESNEPLPENTTIKLIDNIHEKIYIHSVVAPTKNTDTSYLYSLSNLKEIGQITDISFDNNPYNYYLNNIINEDFEIILDFEDSNITTNKEYKIDLIITDNDTVVTKSIEYQTPKKFTIVKQTSDNPESVSALKLTTTYEGYINLSTIQENLISLTTEIISPIYNNYPVFDTNIDKNKLSFTLHIEDSKGNVVTNQAINGLMAKANNNKYYPQIDGTIRFSTNQFQNDLTLSVNYLINDLPNGVYYLKINSCLTSKLCSNTITIPVNVDNSTTITNFELSISLDSYDRMIIKNKNLTMNNDQQLNFTINYISQLTNPNLRIKLYKKQNFSYENQIYELVKLTDFIKNELTETKENSNEFYLMTGLEETNLIDLNLKMENFQYGSYKLIFSLYDDESYITEESITILVK